MKTTLTLAAVVLASLLSLGVANTASAQEVQITGPLAGAPACRSCRIYREGRFMIQPLAGFTLQDEFSRTILFGAQLQYHFTDWLGLGVWGGYGAIHIDTTLTDQVGSRGQTKDTNALSLPRRQNFTDQIGQMKWVAAGQLTFIPLRGKMSLFQKLFVDTDFYLFGGVAAVGLEERADVSKSEAETTCGAPFVGNPPAPTGACLDTQTARASRVAIAPTFGVGLVLYFNQFIGMSLEWRALPFSWNTSGTDEAGSGKGGEFPDGAINSDDRLFHFNHMFNLGFIFYLPTGAGTSE